MASVRDLVNAGFDEGLVKQAVDAAGFERKRGRGGLDLDAKGVAKVVKKYLELLTKLTTKATKFTPDKLNYGTDEEPAPKPKAEKKAPPVPKAKAKPAPVEEKDDEEDEAEDDDEIVEAEDDEEDEE